MTSAPTLFDHPARATDPETSHDAARLDRSTLTDLRDHLDAVLAEPQEQN